MSPPAGVVDGLLAGRYRLAARLGSGANGEVWRAHDERLGRDVAVKVLRPELADDGEVRARFRAEARHAGGLRHPGIAAVFDFAEDDSGAWLVMELVDGQPLSDVLRQEGRLAVGRTLDVVEQTAAALQAAHEGGVVHRDVKPGNLLLRRDGRLSVTDFGIAHATGAAALTRTGQVVGTAAYLSPEQASGQPVSPATDLYAVGVVVHECLSGVRPFERDDPVAVLLAHLQTPPPPLPPDVPAPVAALVRRLMAKDPADRPASARLVQQEAAALRARYGTAPAPTAVLPAVAPSAAAPAVVPSVVPPAGPSVLAPTVTAGRAAGLAGRPGQRRAVRATAVALGLLALALGVRDAMRDDASTPPAPRPATSAPPAPAAPEQGPAVQPQDDPAQEPAAEPAPPLDAVEDQPAQDVDPAPPTGEDGQGEGTRDTADQDTDEQDGGQDGGQGGGQDTRQDKDRQGGQGGQGGQGEGDKGKGDKSDKGGGGGDKGRGGG